VNPTRPFRLSRLRQATPTATFPANGLLCCRTEARALLDGLGRAQNQAHRRVVPLHRPDLTWPCNMNASAHAADRGGRRVEPPPTFSRVPSVWEELPRRDQGRSCCAALKLKPVRSDRLSGPCGRRQSSGVSHAELRPGVPARSAPLSAMAANWVCGAVRMLCPRARRDAAANRARIVVACSFSFERRALRS